MTPIKVEQVTQADRDLRDALEHCAHMDKLGNGFLTDDALPILAAARIAAEAKTFEEAARIAKGYVAKHNAWNTPALYIADSIATAICMETDNGRVTLNSIGTDRED